MAGRVAGVYVRSVVKEDADVLFLPSRCREVERRLSGLGACVDVGASAQNSICRKRKCSEASCKGVLPKSSRLSISARRSRRRTRLAPFPREAA